MFSQTTGLHEMHCREQLHRSDNRNLEGQKSLQLLKEQFDNISTARRSSRAAALASPRGSGNLAPGSPPVLLIVHVWR